MSFVQEVPCLGVVGLKSTMHILKLISVSLIFVLMSSCSSSNIPSPTAGPVVPVAPPPLSATGLSTNLPLNQAALVYNFEQVNDVINPFSTQPVKVQLSQQLKISGWAVDAPAKDLGKGVDVVIDGTPVSALYPSDRADVAKYFKIPAYGKAGFQLIMPALALAKGNHTVQVRLITKAGTAYYQGLPLDIFVE